MSNNCITFNGIYKGSNKKFEGMVCNVNVFCDRTEIHLRNNYIKKNVSVNDISFKYFTIENNKSLRYLINIHFGNYEDVETVMVSSESVAKELMDQLTIMQKEFKTDCVKQIVEKQIFKDHVEKQIFRDHVEKQIFRDHIEKIFLEAKVNDSIGTILINFILLDNTLTNAIFLDPNYLSFFEYKILLKDPLGKDLLWSNEYSIQEYKRLEKENLLNPEFENPIKSYITHSFNMLIKLIEKQITLDNESGYRYLTLKLLQYSLTAYLSELFSKLYGNYFVDIESLTFEECVEIYYVEENIDNKKVDIGLFTYFLMVNRKFEENDNYLKCRLILDEYLDENKEELNFKIWEKKLTKKPHIESSEYTLTEIDLMSGNEFELFVASLFNKIGYRNKITQHSFDQGIDIIAERDGVRIGVQAKRYSNVVTNSAIQEVVAGLRLYNCSKGIVVTNSYFTKSAKELAKANYIKLWDREVLEEKIKEFFSG